VLALAVAAVWKGRVLAADISPEAIRRVRTNQKSNPPWGWRVVPVLGALSCCRGPFDVILANLVPSVHVNAGQTLWETLGPGGWLVLAGFRETQNDLVAGLFLAKGAEAKACLCEEGWTGLLLRKPDVGKL
jgi:ribosomal protein L11 methyltransferase